MELTADFLKSIFPEFKDYENKTIQYFIDSNSKKLNKDFYNIDWEMAVLNLSAHQTLLAKKGSNKKGELVSETIAGVDRTYKTSHTNPNDSYFLSTIYGSEYLRIKKENSYFRGFTTWKFLLKKK